MPEFPTTHRKALPLPPATEGCDSLPRLYEVTFLVPYTVKVEATSEAIAEVLGLTTTPIDTSHIELVQLFVPRDWIRSISAGFVEDVKVKEMTK